MSGGEQQMLAIGRALMARPKLLLLDEPSMGLAPKLIKQIFDIVTEINSQGTTVLLVEQNAAQALKRAHRAYILETGEIVREGTGAELAGRRLGQGGVPRRRGLAPGGDARRRCPAVIPAVTAAGQNGRGPVDGSAQRDDQLGEQRERRAGRGAGPRPGRP